MLDFVQNQPARIPIRLLNNVGTPVVGVAQASVSVTIEKADGTIVNVVLDTVNNSWAEVTSGAFVGQGKYDLVLSATHLGVLGSLVISVVGGVGSAMGLVQVVDIDRSPPTIQNFSPAVGTPIQPDSTISFDVTDNSGLRKVLIAVSFNNVIGVEVAYDGTIFRPPYASGSSRTTISGGSRYAIKRDGGWPAAPTFEVFAIDTAGNEAS